VRRFGRGDARERCDGGEMDGAAFHASSSVVIFVFDARAKARAARMRARDFASDQ
jgi:hypothetical protein